MEFPTVREIEGKQAPSGIKLLFSFDFLSYFCYLKSRKLNMTL